MGSISVSKDKKGIPFNKVREKTKKKVSQKLAEKNEADIY
jgi:hypothetical protein